MQPLNWKVSEKAIQWSLEHALGKIILPSETSALRDRRKSFTRLIAELKRLVSKRGYSLAQIASEVGVTQMTVNHWWTAHSLMAQRENIERLKEFLTAHA